MRVQQTEPESQVPVKSAAVDDFRRGFRGPLLRAEEPGYEDARRVWNGMIDKRPTLIARCTSAADVRAAVEFARTHGVGVSVRGGGHNVAGRAVCEGGLMIDLSLMKDVRVDRSSRRARAQGGVTWGEFDRETQAFGLATTGGAVSTTGIAGLTLGGGVGWLMGKHGMTCDNLLSVDVVTADGAFLTASSAENADLFWGLRGGGGNLGIATSFEYRLHPVGPVLGGMVLHPLSAATELLRFYREFSAAAPDELTAYAAFLTSPEGMPLVAVIVCYCGDLTEGERVLAPLRRFGAPVADLVQPMPYTAQQSILDAGAPRGQHSYWKAGQLSALSDEAIETIVAHCAQVSSPRTVSLVEHHHGAMSRVAPEACAFPHRHAPYELVVISLWTDPSESERHIGWTREFFRAMQPCFRGGVYVNALDDDEADRVREAYGSNYDRLVELKNRYDPTNFFRQNQNIVPTIQRELLTAKTR